jgi:N-acetylglucosaminyldiphosphoundecaprenol N-acetyl-beta-D-mannosaminyltransferase
VNEEKNGTLNPSGIRQYTDRVRMFGCDIDNLSMEEAVDRVNGLIAAGGVHRYFALNVNKIVAFRRQPQFRDIANRSDLITADGQPVVWASRLLGKRLKERVAGVDLMERVITLAQVKGYRVFLLGARQEVLDEVLRRYRDRYPGLHVVGSHNGYWSPERERDVVADIRSSRPDLLFVAMSSPRKEVFMDLHSAEMHVPFMMGVGGSFDVIAGTSKRAPAWMRSVGLEWTWRVLQEPARMWKRYFLDGLVFPFLVLGEMFAPERK